MKLLTAILLFITLHCSAQEMSYNTVSVARSVGLFLNEDGWTASKRANVARDDFNVSYVRSRIVIDNWNSISNDLLDAYENKGLLQSLTVIPHASGGLQSFITDAERDDYKTAVAEIAAAYPFIQEWVINNEPQDITKRSGGLRDYGENELKASYEVLHPLGKKVYCGGILNNPGLKIKTFRYVYRTYGSSEANSYAANSGMTTPQKNDALDSNSNATWEAYANQIDSLYAYRNYMDAVNFHGYELASNSSDSIISTNVFRYQIEYLTDYFKKPVISNETGIWYNNNSGLMRAHLNNLWRLGVRKIIVYSADDTNTDGLTDADGTMRPLGDAFKEWNNQHK